MLPVENKVHELVSPLSFLDCPGITGTRPDKQVIKKRSEIGCRFLEWKAEKCKSSEYMWGGRDASEAEAPVLLRMEAGSDQKGETVSRTPVLTAPQPRGAGVAQLVKCPILDLSSGLDLRVVS